MRREKTRLRLLVSALPVFAEKGPDAPVIDEFLAASGVSRGTFYYHYRTTADLFVDLASSMSDEVLKVTDELIRDIEDPIERCAAGARLYVRMALRYPMWGNFLTRAGARVANRGHLTFEYVTRDLDEAIKRKRIPLKDLRLGRDLLLGSTFRGIETALTEPVGPKYPELLIQQVLMGFGVDATEARRIVSMPLPRTGEVKGPIFSLLGLSQLKAKPVARRGRLTST